MADEPGGRIGDLQLAAGRCRVELHGDAGRTARLAAILDLAAPSANGAPHVVVVAADGALGELVEVVEEHRTAAGTAAGLVLVAPRVPAVGLRRLLAAGVHGVVLEHASEDVLPATVAAVSRGQLCIPRDIAPIADPGALSVRERQLLGMVVLGMSNAEIAGQLFLSESTVKNHLTSAFSKLGVRSRNEARSLLLDSENGLGLGVLTIPDAEPIADDQRA